MGMIGGIQRKQKLHGRRESNSYFDIEVDRKLVEIVRHGDVIVTSYTASWLVPEKLNR